MTTPARRTAAEAAGVRRAGSPGRGPRTARCPSGPARRATATVASADRRFSTMSIGPVPAPSSGGAAPATARRRRAAASATDGVPTAASTTGLGLGTTRPARRCAGKTRRPTPRAAANSTIAGSPAFCSTDATQATASTDRPASASVPRTSRCRASGSAPRLDPTPSTSDLGVSTTSPTPGSTARSVTITVAPARVGRDRAGRTGRIESWVGRDRAGRDRAGAARRRGRVALHRRRGAVEPGPGHGGDVAGGGEALQRVEGREAGAVGGGRHHRLGPEEGGHRPGEDVGAAPVPAGEGDGEAPAVVDDDHGRVGRLVGQEGGDGPHRDPGGADEHEPVDLGPPGPHRVEEVAGAVLVGQPPGDVRSGRRDGAGQDPSAAAAAAAHGHEPGRSAPASGPQHTKTGFSAASRRAPLPPRGAPRLTDTWTSCPSRPAAATARSRAA